MPDSFQHTALFFNNQTIGLFMASPAQREDACVNRLQTRSNFYVLQLLIFTFNLERNVDNTAS